MQESSIADILRQASYLERNYSHYFDHTVMFTDVETVYKELLKVADRLDLARSTVGTRNMGHLNNRPSELSIVCKGFLFFVFIFIINRFQNSFGVVQFPEFNLTHTPYI